MRIVKSPLPTQLRPLAKLLDRDEPRVLVVVGTGITAGATSAPHASWSGLLNHAVGFLLEREVISERKARELKTALNVAFSPFNLKRALKCAELLEQNLRKPSNNLLPLWLKDTFHNLKARTGRTDTLQALLDLQQMGALLLTTNYDSLLSHATGLPPVTWEEHVDFLKVMHGHRPGILHIHGHWQRPNSIVLGKSSYDRVVADRYFQDLFKSLWLEWNWLYVGCGNGLDDPNLGRLLAWGEHWGKAALPQYFLAKAAKAAVNDGASVKAGYIIRVGYPDHTELPGLLRSLSPANRCQPFLIVNEEFPLFRDRKSPFSVPVPSRPEYLDGTVPALEADEEIRARLIKHGWAFILDVASVGKTTLALRLATAPGRNNHPTYYLNLADLNAETDHLSSAALRRISRPNALLIIDNVHRNPELGRTLWDQWQSRRRGSNLLLIATRMQLPVITGAMQDMSFFENHPTNPSVGLRPTPEDLGAIMQHLYWRVGGRHAVPLNDPHPETLRAWHRTYGSALDAFCVSVLARLAKLQDGEWNLPPEAASEWVRQTWLVPVGSANRKNLICLAAFGAQQLELQVPTDALPHPRNASRLLASGLVETSRRGVLSQHTMFRLREPGWGRLILAAQGLALDEEKILFETAARHPLAAWTLNIRLRQAGSFEQIGHLWAYLASKPNRLIKLLPELPLGDAVNLPIAARSGLQPMLANRFWKAIERDPIQLAARAGRIPLNQLAIFLNTAKDHGREVSLLWETLERAPERLAMQAKNAPLRDLTTFLEVARRHQRNTDILWEALKSDPKNLISGAWDTLPGELAAFLETAHRHGRDTAPLWKTLESHPKKLADWLRASSLGYVTSFLKTAIRQGRDTAPFWKALERAPRKLVDRLWETPLAYVTSFLDTAKQQKRDTARLWEALEREPARLTARAWEAPLSHVGLFQTLAKEHGRNPNVLWDALEAKPSFVERLRRSPLAEVASFLDAAKRQERNTGPLWEAVEGEPASLAARALETRLEHVAIFQTLAKDNGRDPNALWEVLEADAKKLASHAAESSLEHIAQFQKIAQEQGRDPTILWQALQMESEKLADSALQESLVQITQFQKLVEEQGGDPTHLWEALERRPYRVAARAAEASLQHVAKFQDTAIKHGHTPKALWKALERRSERLSAMVREASVPHLGAFCRHAPDPLVRIALAGLQKSHWDQILDSKPWPSAIWLAYRFAEVGRDDLKSGMMNALLRRANPADFPPYGRSLANIAWLFKNVPPEASVLIPGFFGSVCTETWLTKHFDVGESGALATGLRLFAFHQPPEIYLRLRNATLLIRIQRELSRFSQVGPTEQGKIVQLLGSASLYDSYPKAEWFECVPLETISKLPQDILSHAADSNKVAGWQLQLWLGLYAVSSATGVNLLVPSPVTAQTLDLWRVNLAESSPHPTSLEHAVNQMMVNWLEMCLRRNYSFHLAKPEQSWTEPPT